MWKKINICIFAFVCEFLTWLWHLYLVSMVVIIGFPPFIYLFSFVVLKLKNLFIALIELCSQWISIFFLIHMNWNSCLCQAANQRIYWALKWDFSAFFFFGSFWPERIILSKKMYACFTITQQFKGKFSATGCCLMEICFFVSFFHYLLITKQCLLYENDFNMKSFIIHIRKLCCHIYH